MTTKENQVTIAALQDRVAELEVMLERNRAAHSQTYDDLQAELAIVRQRYGRMRDRADVAEKQAVESKEEAARLHERIHDLNGDLTAAFGILQFFVPDEQALETLAHSGDEAILMEWPCRLAVGDFRAAAEVVQHIIKNRFKNA